MGQQQAPLLDGERARRGLQDNYGELFGESGGGANGWVKDDKKDYERKEIDNLGAPAPVVAHVGLSS